MKRNQLILILLTFLCLGSVAGCCGQPSSDDLGQDSPKSGDFYPQAVVVNNLTGSELTLLDAQGETLDNIPADNSNDLFSDNTIFIRKLGNDASQMPFVYTTYSPQTSIQMHQNGSDQMLRTFDSLGSIAGSRGDQAIAFSEVVNDDYSLNSYLYVGSPDTIGFTTSVYEMEDYLQQWVIAPEAVDTVDGQPSGVWYTTTGWGVGGPGMFFPVTRGLYYFDTASASVKEYLGDDQSLQGLSPDRTMAGSIPTSSYLDHDMTITNLVTHWMLHFPLKATSDQGSGLVTFAQDNQHAAWLEVGTSPYDEYDYNYVVRVGSLNAGEIEFEIDENAVAQALQFSDLDSIQPLGWLDSSTLLIQAHGLDWNDARIAKLKPGRPQPGRVLPWFYLLDLSTNRLKKSLCTSTKLSAQALLCQLGAVADLIIRHRQNDSAIRAVKACHQSIPK